MATPKKQMCDTTHKMIQIKLHKYHLRNTFSSINFTPYEMYQILCAEFIPYRDCPSKKANTFFHLNLLYFQNIVA